MNKLLIPGIIAAVVILGVAAFVLLGRSNSSSQTTPNESGANQLDGQNRSIKDLIGLVGNQECTFSDDQGNSGIVYGGSGKVRGDFVGTQGGQSVNSHVIYDGADVYMWFDGSSDGFKASMASMENTEVDPDTAGVDINRPVNYECRDWSIDNSKYDLPDGVTFTDFGSFMMPGGATRNPSSGTGLEGTDACNMCNSLPEGAREQCLAAC